MSLNTLTEDVILESLKKYFGFEGFKGNQKEIIQNVLSGEDTFVIMPTGGGKSLCYQLPAMMSEGTAIVISPLIALMKNQVDLIRGYSSNDNIAHFLNSSLNKTQVTKVKEDIRNGDTKVLYVAPESLVKEDYIEFLKSVTISFVAVDEAHCISEWGHDFRPEYRKIRKMIKEIDDDIPMMALTATATPKVQSDIMKTLRMEKPKIFISSFLRESLYYEIRPKLGKDVTLKDMVQFIKQSSKGKCGIVYCLSRKSTEEVAQVLQVNGINAAPYHAGLDANVRAKTQDDFLMEDVDVIVATIAFGMGIDKPDVRFVIHYDIPKSIENYYQETGRAGRDGLGGTCIAYFAHKDIEKLEKFMRDKPVAEREVTLQHLMEVTAYAETSECRKRFILHYFGENFDSNCGEMCDNCRNPKEKIDAQSSIQEAIKAIKQVDEQFKQPYMVNFLTGKKTKDITTFKHDQLELFGTGKEKEPIYWNTVIRKAQLENLLAKDIEQYGVLKISEKGNRFIEQPYPIHVVLNHTFPKTNGAEEAIITSTKGEGNVLDPVLLGLLKDHRKKVAQQKGLPPYVIFQDPSLEDMACRYPINKEELGNITGVSQGKALKFGKGFMALIEQYVEDNNIDRPTDFTVKSMVNKSGQKVSIIQNIDKKIPLE